MSGKTLELNPVEQNTEHINEQLRKTGMQAVPFETRLSFLPLIRHLRDNIQENSFTGAMLSKEILKRMENNEELNRCIQDPKILEKHRETVDLLIACVLPPVLRDTQLAKVSAPFDMTGFYYTPALRNLTQNNEVEFVATSSADIIYCASVLGACSLILNKYYEQDISVAPPISMTVQAPDSPIKRYFKTKLDLQFVDIKKTKPLKPLTQEQINGMLSNVYDTDLWLQHIPPENFEFEGFVIGHLIEITEEEALSQLKFRLLRKDAIVDSGNVRELEQLIRTFLGLEELRLGITAIDYPVENAVSHRYKIRFDFLADQRDNLISEATRNSIYEKACKYREVLLVEDLEKIQKPTPIEQELMAQGLRSIIVAPLLNKNDKVIGLLEIGSPTPYELHSFIELKFRQITPLFSLAVERSREEIDNQVEAIIREQFTAVHPSVEWKFIETSYNLLEQRSRDPKKSAVDPIVFEDVYPLYAQADIVSSSTMRNDAIQGDLVDNLRKVKKVIHQCLNYLPFPLLDHALTKINRYLDELEKEFNSNDESRIVNLLHEEVHPILAYLRSRYPDLAGLISGYFNYLDPELKIVYRRRRDYEQSVSIVNNSISNFLEEKEKETQAVLPHYFEKYKTDGVEYEMYIGQSLLKKEQFCMMHLRNLRLWQLIHMVEITRLINDLQSDLPVPMQTAQLIFAYTTSLSIRFRMDEKQFDVDGAYNVRYEILKKRIDKALVEGTGERLTIAGKVAIVYLQEKDRLEYLEYIDYLQEQNYLTGEVEELLIGRLQGVHGLRALRVTVIV